VHRWLIELEKLLNIEKIRKYRVYFDKLNITQDELIRSISYWHIYMQVPVIPFGPFKGDSILKEGYGILREIDFPRTLPEVREYIKFLFSKIGPKFNIAVICKHRYGEKFTCIDIDNHNPEVSKLDSFIEYKGKQVYVRNWLINECVKHGIYIEETGSKGFHIIVRGKVDIKLPRELSHVQLFGSERGNVIFIYPTHFLDKEKYQIYPTGIAPNLIFNEDGVLINAIPKADPTYLDHIITNYLKLFIKPDEIEISKEIIGKSHTLTEVDYDEIKRKYLQFHDFEHEKILDYLNNEQLLILIYLIADFVNCPCVKELIIKYFENGKVFPIFRNPYPGTGRCLHFHIEIQLIAVLYMLGLSEEKAIEFCKIFKYPDGIVESPPEKSSLVNVYRYKNINIACTYLCPISYALYEKHICNEPTTFSLKVRKNLYIIKEKLPILIKGVFEIWQRLNQ